MHLFRSYDNANVTMGSTSQESMSLGNWPSESRHIWTESGAVHVSAVGTGEPVLILPGLWGGSALWEPFAHRLRDRYRVIRFDWPGEGRSFETDPIRHRFRPDEIVDRVIESMNLTNLTILAHSFAADVITTQLDRLGDTIRAVILSGHGASDCGGTADVLTRKLIETDLISIGNPILPHLARLALGPSVNSLEAFHHTVSSIRASDPRGIRQRLQWRNSHSAEAFAAEPRFPMTLVAGRRDVFAPEVCQQMRASRLSGCRFESVPDAGHLGFLTHGAAFAAALDRATRTRTSSRNAI